jgi:NTE family protein
LHKLEIRHIQKFQSETVLVLQGGGSLGAYECGVYKTLSKHDIKFDIVAGTSIGAVNGAIIVGSKNDDPAKDLEDFWLDVSEKITPSFLPDNTRSITSSFYGALYGNSKAFLPIWFMPNQNSLFSYKQPYLYDTTPLKNTLNKYIDFKKLNKSNIPRLIVTATNLQTSEPVIFDSMSTNVDSDHLLGCASFPFYGISWVEKDGKYLWDGSLLSNTPLREVIDVSPRRDKKVYIVNLFPRIQNELPENIFDSWHRARDIVHTDKTDHNIRMSEVISRYLSLLKDMHDILNNVQLDENKKERFFQIEREYHKLAEDRGAIIQEITKIERSEDIHFIFEDADFSTSTIKKLIRQGEKDAEAAITQRRDKTTK